MDRANKIKRFVSASARGIEIGPWCNPLAAKAEGYNCLVLDIFDGQQLRKNALNDAGIPNHLAEKIEDVDLIGSSADIADLITARGELGAFDYVMSSHNFEHIPNPVKFLQGCQKVLSLGGVLSMAIPDRRGCFDYFRPSSTLAQMLQAFAENRTKPTAHQVFERFSLHAHCLVEDQDLISFPITSQPRHIQPYDTLEQAYAIWLDATNSSSEGGYRDTHCWTFTPASFELIIGDLQFLGLIHLELVDIDRTGGSEFFVHLRNIERPDKQDRADFYLRRAYLLHLAQSESAEASAAFRALLDASSSNIDQDKSVHAGDMRELERTLQEQRLRSRFDLAQQEILHLGKRLSKIESSRSWRITSPLRKLMSCLRNT